MYKAKPNFDPCTVISLICSITYMKKKMTFLYGHQKWPLRLIFMSRPEN